MNARARLTRREQEVGELIAWGAIKKEVAHRLSISVHTVENHVRNIFEKTECRSANEFSAWYFCTHFNISMELSPLKNVVASLLLIIYLSGDIFQGIDLFTRGQHSRQTVSEIRRTKIRRDDLDITFY